MKVEIKPPDIKPDIVLTLSWEEAETLLFHTYHTLPSGFTYTGDLRNSLSSVMGIRAENARKAVL